MSGNALREEAYKTLKERIITGTLKPGSRIIESRLSKDLHVSRTPLREALLQLAAEGLTESCLNKGFSVAELSAREVRELYPILSNLEALALESSGTGAFNSIIALDRINQQFKKLTGKPEQAINWDSNFHNQLIQSCPNRELLRMISELRVRIERYEFIYMKNSSHLKTSFSQHSAIVTALKNSNLPEAADSLRVNWRFGMETLLRQLGEVI